MKQYHQYQMDFRSKWCSYSALGMGLSVFLSVLYYLGLNNMEDIGIGELAFCLWLPLVVGVAYIILLRGVRWNAPGVYAIVGAVFSVIYILSGFAGGAGKALISIPAYILCAVVLVIVVGGFFPARLPAVLLYGIVIVLRIILFDLGRLSATDWIIEGATLCGLAAFMFLPLALKDRKRRKEQS